MLIMISVLEINYVIADSLIPDIQLTTNYLKITYLPVNCIYILGTVSNLAVLVNIFLFAC